MLKIPDSITGYLDVGTDTFAFSVNKHVVTLLPASADPSERSDTLSRLEAHNAGTRVILYGKSGIDHYAFFYNGQVNRGLFKLSPSAAFSTPLIIKSSGNCYDYYERFTESWEKFHAITFFGGNINPVFNPGVAVVGQTPEELVREDGAREIKIRPFDDYTKKVNIRIGGEDAEITISVRQGEEGNNTEKRGAYVLGLLNSFIRFTFSNVQAPEQIPEYHRIIRELLAVLTCQNNVSFEFDLSQMNSNNQLYPSAICKTFDRYENYAVKSYGRVVSIISVADFLPGIIEKLSAHKADALLAVLPDNNKNVGRISITNVQDLCTALEVAYDWDDKRAKQKKIKDNTLKELKEKIDGAIAEFKEDHPELDPNKQTTISKAFEYLSYTAKTRILTLYDENKEFIDPILKKWRLPQINDESVSKFVKLRNGKTHGGAFEWGDSADIYVPLLALVYVCFFKSVDIPDDIIHDALRSLF